MTTVLFVRRFLADYARNPVNLLLIVVVPVAFVVVAAGPMGSFAKLALFGSGGSGAAIQTAAAGWAAGFLSAIAMYFQVSAARDTGRRLVISGLPAARLVTARLTAGLTLAGLASAAALRAPRARSEVLELFAQGERTVDAVARTTGMGMTNTSAHLQLLRQARLVDTRKDGTRVFYRLAGDEFDGPAGHRGVRPARRRCSGWRTGSRRCSSPW